MPAFGYPQVQPHFRVLPAKTQRVVLVAVRLWAPYANLPVCLRCLRHQCRSCGFGNRKELSRLAGALGSKNGLCQTVAQDVCATSRTHAVRISSKPFKPWGKMRKVSKRLSDLRIAHRQRRTTHCRSASSRSEASLRQTPIKRFHSSTCKLALVPIIKGARSAYASAKLRF